MKPPRAYLNQLWRYIGPGTATGTLHRVLLCKVREIGTVQEAPIPNWSWLGSPEEFYANFIFRCDLGPNLTNRL